MRVLEGLRKQSLPLDQWELLIIDNASEEPVKSEKWNLDWHPHARLIREDKLGLAYARLRGMQEAVGDLIVFVDDDNVLDAKYLEEAARIQREWPTLGVWGSGLTVPEFEVEPPDYLRRFMGFLALRDEATARWSNVIPCIGALPWGAGQCVRAAVADIYQTHFNTTAIKLSGRQGRLLTGCEDVEIAYIACTMGLGVGVFPELKLTHLIPKERVREDYIVRLVRGTETSTILLEFKWKQIFPRSPFSGLLGVPRVLKNIACKSGIERRLYIAWLCARLDARAFLRRHKLDRTQRNPASQ